MTAACTLKALSAREQLHELRLTEIAQNGGIESGAHLFTSARLRRRWVVDVLVHLLTYFVVFVVFGFLHPKEEFLLAGVKFENIDATSSTLFNALEHDIAREDNQISFYHSSRSVFPHKVQ